MQNDNKAIICGWLIVPTEHMNIFPAVSITKLSINKNKVIVKYKNTLEVMYGEGIRIQNKNELDDDGYVNVVDI